MGLLQFLLEDFFAAELGLKELRNTVHLGGRNLDALLLAFELDQFLAHKIVNHSIAELRHHFFAEFFARSLLLTEHLSQAVDFSGRNTHFFDANHVHALAIEKLCRSNTRSQGHG